MTQFSILVPVYNGANYLSQAIESVLNQTFTDFELLIRDDGSTDKSLEIIKHYQDARIRILQSDERLGLFENLNVLCKAALSPLIHIFCQDDILEKQCLEREWEFFKAHPEIGMSFSKSQAIDEKGSLHAKPIKEDLPEVMTPELSLQHFFYHGCIPGNLSTVCIRKKAFEDLGPFNSQLKVSGDYDLWSRISAQLPLGVIHQSLVQLRHHEDRLSHQTESTIQFIKENRAIRKKLIPLLPSFRQKDATRFEKKRHGVLDFHQGFNAIRSGNWRLAKRIFSTFGGSELVESGLYWLFTGNNHFYRPQAKWVLPHS
jgi:glycosyltransferase involved in cell wall biosynthesis